MTPRVQFGEDRPLFKYAGLSSRKAWFFVSDNGFAPSIRP
jgi:hypothetical protein